MYRPSRSALQRRTFGRVYRIDAKEGCVCGRGVHCVRMISCERYGESVAFTRSGLATPRCTCAIAHSASSAPATAGHGAKVRRWAKKTAGWKGGFTGTTLGLTPFWVSHLRSDVVDGSGNKRLTICEPAKSNRPLCIRPRQHLVVNESGQQRAALPCAGMLGREELRQQFHVVELTLDSVRERNLRWRHQRRVCVMASVSRSGSVDGCLLGANDDMRIRRCNLAPAYRATCYASC